MELNEFFIEELFKASITDKSFLEIMNKHLGYENLPAEEYKLIWKEVNTFYEINSKLPTIGIISKRISENCKDVTLKRKCEQVLVRVKKSDIKEVKEDLLVEFEKYKKNSDFKNLYNEVYDLYNEGQQEKAMQLMSEKAQEITNFKIKSTYYERLFSGFDKRQTERELRDPGDENRERITTGIHEQDNYIMGGYKRGTSFLGLARSGSGKSTYLRWVAIQAAREGYTVVLFSLEGTKQENLEALDSCWSGTRLEDIEYGKLNALKRTKIEKSIRDFKNNEGEVFVYCPEAFDSMTIDDCRNVLKDIEQIHDKPIDMVLFDYLELFDLKNTPRVRQKDFNERMRREMIANQITNIGIEFNCVAGTMTQANDIAPSSYNDPDFVLTRSHISEFKGALKPFSYFFTINQTDEEKEQNVARIYNDKFRKHRSGQTIRIFQLLEIGRFYDAKKTLMVFYDKAGKKPKILPSRA